AKAYYRRVYSEYTQLGSIFAIRHHCVAAIDALTARKVGDVWRVPLRYFEEDAYTEQLTVVCENDNDYEIYKAFAKVWMRKHFPACVVSSRSRAGHGGSTTTVLRRLAEEGNPVYLCLL